MLMSKPVPPISKEFFTELEQTFGSKRVADYRPNKQTIEEIMFQAGQAQVVEWARKYIRGQASSGNVEVIVKPN